LESGQEEIERRNRRRKEAAAHGESLDSSSLRSSVESLRSPTTSHPQTPTLNNISEADGTFAIGDDEEDSDDDHRPTPSQSTTSENPSQAGSTTGNVEDAVPMQLRGMSEKARGKMPAGASSFSRQNSNLSQEGTSGSRSQSGIFEPNAEWIESWLPGLPLHTILTILQQVSALLPRQALTVDHAAPETLRKIQEIQLVGVEPSLIRVHSFEWSPLALGWYESLIWSLVFSSELQFAKGSVGIWNATAIKLFRVQETAPEGPTFTSPRGAVDAVGSNIVSRIGAINLRGSSGSTTANAPQQGTGTPGQ
jgi:High-temperature-induced dauer-formation protein